MNEMKGTGIGSLKRLTVPFTRIYYVHTQGDSLEVDMGNPSYNMTHRSRWHCYPDKKLPQGIANPLDVESQQNEILNRKQGDKEENVQQDSWCYSCMLDYSLNVWHLAKHC